MWLVLILFGLIIVMALAQISAGGAGMFWLGVAATILSLALLAVIAIFAASRIRQAQESRRQVEHMPAATTPKQAALDPTTALLLMALRPNYPPPGQAYPDPQQPAQLPAQANYWSRGDEQQPVDGQWEDYQ